MSDIKDIKDRFREEFGKGGRKKSPDSKTESPPIVIENITTNGGTIIIGNNNVVNAAAVSVIVVAPTRWTAAQPALFADCPATASPIVRQVLDALAPRNGVEVIILSARSAKSHAEIAPVAIDPAQSVSNRAALDNDDAPAATPQSALMSATLAEFRARRGQCQNDHLPTPADRLARH